MSSRILSRIARQHGGKLLDGAVSKLLPEPAAKSGQKSGLVGKVIGAALVRIATKSVPGAIIIGGGMLAKALHEQRKAKRAAKPETP